MNRTFIPNNFLTSVTLFFQKGLTRNLSTHVEHHSNVTYTALKSSGTYGRHTFIHAIYSNTQIFKGSTKSFIYFIHVLAGVVYTHHHVIVPK